MQDILCGCECEHFRWNDHEHIISTCIHTITTDNASHVPFLHSLILGNDLQLCNLIAACSNGEIRLVGGSVPNEGRVQVCQNQAWGTVCDDHWGNVDASVAWRQLSYSGQSKIHGKYNVMNVQCTPINMKHILFSSENF